MATVFRATEIALEREVAIKVMSTQAASSPGAFERFQREARMAAALSHPHIVPIYAIGEDPDLAYFAMKFIEGRGLDAILRKEGAQPIDAVARTIGVVGQALNYAHERGVVHRDVKPANIMVGDDGWTYVTDFGIAKRDDAKGLTQAGTVIGTPAYMSPEQFNGLPITGAADQYSLGIVAFEMLTGRAPFDKPSLGEVMRGHLLEPVPPIRALRIDVPVPVAECVTRMLEKEPGSRYPTLADAVTALEEAAAVVKRTTGATGRPSLAPTAAPGPKSTPRSSPTTPLPRPAPSVITTGAARRPVTAARQRAVEKPSGGPSVLGALLLLLVIVGGGGFLMRDRIAALIAPVLPPVASVGLPDSTSPPDGTPDSASTPGDPVIATGTEQPRGSAAGTERELVAAPPTERAPAASVDSAIAMFAARVADSHVMEVIPFPDSAVIRVGSQTLETVLFVNDRQLGIVGGRGLVSTTVAPGPVTVSVKRVSCRDWDTTFTALANRRYTFGERSPIC